MRFTLPIVALSAVPALAFEGHAEEFFYRRGVAAEGDSRSPCPALNTLANIGKIPRNGKSIKSKQLIDGIIDVYNVDPAFGAVFAAQLPISNTTGTMDLGDLNKHDFIEHDASLTRNDFSQNGDNQKMQPRLLAQLLADGEGTDLTIESLAKTRARREDDVVARGNAETSAKGLTLGYGEAALLLQAMNQGNSTESPRAPKRWVAEWVGLERLPRGYRRPASPISALSTNGMAAKIKMAATPLRRVKGAASPPAAGPVVVPSAAPVMGGSLKYRNLN